MTTRYIRAPRLHEHVLITPTSTVRHGAVSYRARGVLSRLLSNSDGYGMTAEALSAEGAGCEGRDAIRTALRELRRAGYIERAAIKSDSGRFGGVVMYVYDTPQAVLNGKPENPSAGYPAAGMPVHKSSGSINEQERSSSKAHVRAAALSENSGAKAATAQSSAGTSEATTGRRWRRTDVETGVVYWLDDEPAEIAHLVETFGLDALKAETARLRNAGTEPLPSIVSKRLQAARRAEVEAQVQQARRQRPTTAERAEDARRAREAFAAIEASRDEPEQPRHRDTRTMEQILAEWAGPRVIP